jgi:L-rhamnose isomerase
MRSGWRRLRRRLCPSRRAARPARHRHRCDQGQGRGYTVAVPSWGVGTGGTRFARFPGPGEPRNIFDKLEDCAVINELTRATPTVSLHIPWDKVSDPNRLKQAASRFGLGFDAMNSNTFSGRAGQPHELQVRLAQPYAGARASRRSSTISNASRSARRSARRR